MRDAVTHRLFSIDEAKNAEFFPMEHVLSEIMRIYAEILNISFKQLEDDSIWHDDVQLYEVTDGKTGAVTGYFFLGACSYEGLRTMTHHCDSSP